MIHSIVLFEPGIWGTPGFQELSVDPAASRGLVRISSEKRLTDWQSKAILDALPTFSLSA